MTVNSTQVVPSGESLAAPVGVALSDFAPPSLSVASGELRAKLILDATAAFSTLSGDQALKVQSLLDTAQQAFTTASDFESKGPEQIRKLSTLDASLSKVTDSMMQVGSACREVSETVLPTLDGAHVEKVSALLQTLSAQAEDISSSITESKSVWREQVFAREVHDKRVAKVDALAATTLRGMSFYLREENLPAEAQKILNDTLAKRVEELLRPLREDPVAGEISAELVNRRKNETRHTLQIRVPESGTGEGQASVTLSDTLRTRIENSYDSLQRRAAILQQIEPTWMSLGKNGCSVCISVNEEGRGQIIFTDPKTDSSITFEVGNKIQSDVKRFEAVEGLRSRLSAYSPTSNKSAAWTVEAAQSALSTINTMAEPSPSVVLKDAFPEAIPGLRIERRVPRSDLTAAQIMAGASSISIMQDGPVSEMNHRLHISIREGQMTAELEGPFPKGAALRLGVAVTSDVSSGGSALDEKAVSRLVAALSKEFVNEVTTSNPAIVHRDKSGVVDALLEIPGARVLRMQSVHIAEGATSSITLTDDARIRLVQVDSGATLKLTGGNLSSQNKPYIESLLGAHGATTVYNLQNATLVDCKDEGTSAGSIRSSKLTRVQMLGTVRTVLEKGFGTVGQPITDSNCVFEGCGWGKAFRWSMEHGVPSILKRK